MHLNILCLLWFQVNYAVHGVSFSLRVASIAGLGLFEVTGSIRLCGG